MITSSQNRNRNYGKGDGGQEKPAVLHVDDDSDYQALFSISFNRHFDVHSAGSAREALCMLENRDFDLLVTDYDMPEMNGIDLLKTVKKKHPHIPVIFHTGQGNENVAREAFTIGAVDYFTKDYISFAFKEKVVNSLNKAVHLKQATEEKKESQKRYKDLVESLQDLVFTTDEEGRITFANLSFERILGIKAETFVGTILLEHIIEEDRKHFTESLGKRLRTGESFIAFEVRMESVCQGIQHIRLNCTPIRDEKNRFRGLTGTGRDISDQVKLEKERALTVLILERLNQSSSPHQSIKDILHLIKEATGIEAVGIRIKRGVDFPYYVTDGFPDHFVERENCLCAREANGEIIYDNKYCPVLECICGRVIRTDTNPELPFFTFEGSFWTNSTTKLIQSAKDEIGLWNLRNHCNAAGYESVALIPLKYGKEVVGLLQLNDRRENCFTVEMIEFFEGVGESIGISLHKVEMQKALRDSESRFRSFFENSPAGMVILSAEDTPVYQEISKSLAETNGLPIEEHIGKTIREIFDDEKISLEHNDLFAEIIRTHKSVTLESFGRTQSGKNGYYLAHYFPVTDWDDRINAIGGVIINLTEKVRAERELKKSEKKYRTLVENLNEGIWQIDREGFTTFVNVKMAEMLGYTTDEMMGKNLREFIEPEKMEEVEYYVERRMKGIREDHDFQFRTKDGEIILAQVSTSPLYDEAGNYSGALAGIMDVTQHRLAERQLKDSEERYRNLVEMLPNTIAEFDHQGNITYLNDSGLKMFGFDKEDLARGMNLSQLTYPEELKRAWSQAPELLTGKKSAGNEYKLIRKDGSTFYAKGYSASVMKDGEHTGRLCTLLDVSDYKALEEKLIKERERFYQVLETIPAYVSLKGSDNKFRYVNRKFQEVFGDPGGKPCFKLIKNADNPCETCPSRGIFADKKSRSWEWKSEKTGRSYLIFCNYLEGVDGEKLALEFGLDITDRVELEQKYRNITESSLQGIGIIQEGRLIFANKALLNTSGFTVDELQITGDDKIPPFIWHIHPDDHKKIYDVTDRLLKENSTPEYNQFRIIRKDGEVLWVESLAHRIEYEGKPAIQFSQVDITDRKKMEDALKKSREQYRMLTENVSEVIYYLDNKGTIIYISPKIIELGFRQDEVIGNNFLTYIFEDDREKMQLYFLDVMKGSEKPSPLFLFQGKDGKSFWMENLTNSVKDKNGNITGMTGILKDVSELIRQQENIKHLNKILRAIRIISQLIVTEHNPQKLIEKACKLLTETRGYEAAGIILLDESGKPAGFSESGYGEHFSCFHGRYCNGDYPFCIEKVFTGESLYVCKEFDKTGCILHLSDKKNICLVKLLKYGKIPGGIIFASIPETIEANKEEIELFEEICTEISYGLQQIRMRESRKQIIEALKHKSRAEENIQIAGIFIMALNTEGKIVMINPKGAGILGADENQLIGKSWVESFIPGEHLEKCRKMFSKLITGKLGSDMHFEDTIINMAGEKKILLQHSTLMRDEQGKIIGVLCTADDITERKKLEEKLKSSLAEKEILLMEINHRTKNNLQILSSLVNHQILMTDNTGTKELLSQIKGRLKAMSVIYEALCSQEDISCINFQEFLEKLFHSVITSYQSGKGNIRIEINAGGVCLDIKKGVACALIINELVSNAVKHAFPDEKQGLVKIGIWVEGDNNYISLSDNGIGIPEGMNIEQTESLGLKIVQLLTRQLKGKISLNSMEGTRWEISFPV